MRLPNVTGEASSRKIGSYDTASLAKTAPAAECHCSAVSP